MPNCKIYGKQHNKGTSKAGKAYDFYSLHLLVKNRFVEGQACKVVMVDPSLIDYDRILVGQIYDISTDFDGNVDSIQPAKT